MSWKPSVSFGGLYRLVNPLKATSGSISLASGFNDLFNERTASLCLQTWVGVVKEIQRIGTLNVLAKSIHNLRVSGSAFVLSGGLGQCMLKTKSDGTEHSSGD